MPTFEIHTPDAHELTILVEGELAVRMSGPITEAARRALLEATSQNTAALIATGIYLGAAAGVFGHVEVKQIDQVPGLTPAPAQEGQHAGHEQHQDPDQLAEQEDQLGAGWPLDPVRASERRSPST